MLISILIIMQTHFKANWRTYLLASLVVISTVLWWAVYYEDHKGLLTFSVLDIGQGDSLFIESPTGTQVLIDGGPNKNLMKEISHVMAWYDRHIDMIIVTNPDLDHYSGFIPLLQKYSADVFMEPGTQAHYPAYDVLEKEVADKKITKILARRGEKIDLGGGAYLEVLFPDRDPTGMSTNDGSIVMKLVYGGTSVMLQGDSTAKIEHYLVGLDGTSLEADILKAGHHGSHTSSSEEYVKEVNPKWMVMSSGQNNEYGHPHKETLETTAKLNIPAYDTCNNGRITFESDGKNFVLKNKNIKEAVVGCRF